MHLAEALSSGTRRHRPPAPRPPSGSRAPDARPPQKRAAHTSRSNSASPAYRGISRLRRRRRSRRTCGDLGAAHAEDGAVEIDVLAAGQFGMKTGADLEQARHPALDLTRPRSAR